MSAEDDPDIATTATRVVYENRWMRVREDKTRLRDGSAGVYGDVEKPDFVIVAPIHDGAVHLVQQYRYPIRARQWEFPQGSKEGPPALDYLSVAAAELEEEAGLRAGTIVEAGRLFPLYGTVTQSYRAFLATDLTPGPPHRELEEQDLVSRPFPLSVFEQMIIGGEIQDAGTVATYALLKMKGLL